jgi:hypothetical protein
MAMRIDLEFARPLTRQERMRLVLVLGGLAKTERVRFGRGDRSAVVLGEGLASMRIQQVLLEEGFACESIVSSLPADEDQRLDDLSAGPAVERVKPPGRA